MADPLATLAALAASPATQSYAVLAFGGLTSLWVTVTRPKLSWTTGADGHHHLAHSPAATLWEAGTSPALSTRAMLLWRLVLSVYIFGMGINQAFRLGTYHFKFYTIWNWWLLGLYFLLAAFASFQSLRAESRAKKAADSSKPAAAVPGNPGSKGSHLIPTDPTALAAAASELGRSTLLARLCHALFLINSSTVIIVDAVCWGVLYPMLARGPQSPEVALMIKRLLLTFTSYNQHGFNALFIWGDLLLNRHRLVFHATGPLGLWSLSYAAWAFYWHHRTGKWLYPFMDTSKPWAPLAYFGLYMVHYVAYGIVASLYLVKRRLYGSNSTGAWKGKAKVQ